MKLSSLLTTLPVDSSVTSIYEKQDTQQLVCVVYQLTVQVSAIQIQLNEERSRLPTVTGYDQHLPAAQETSLASAFITRSWERRCQVDTPCSVDKFFKQQRRPLKAHSVRHVSSALLYYVYDPLSRNKFFIDTGAEVGVLPATANQKTLPTVTHLYAANGTKIPVYKRQTLQLELNLRRSFKWTFYMGAVSQAILGADFLTHFDLLVDIKNRKLQNPLTSIVTSAATTTGKNTSISTVSADNPYASLLKSFPTLTQPYFTTDPANHHVTHHIETTGPPTYAKSRRLAPERYQTAKSEFETLLHQGIIHSSSSNWSSALHIVSKKTIWRLSCAQLKHRQGQVSGTQHSRVLSTLRLYHLFQGQPHLGASPDSSQSSRYIENGHHHPVWLV